MYVALKWLETAIHLIDQQMAQSACDINPKRPDPFIFMTDVHKLFFEGLHLISKCSNLKRLSPVFCCCPSRLRWCSRLRPRPLQWERWTGRCLRRGSQIWTKTLHLRCRPRTGHHTGLEGPNTAPTYWNLWELLESSFTFTEWLWKSVTIISFLLFTATKWGPGWGKRWGLAWNKSTCL